MECRESSRVIAGFQAHHDELLRFLTRRTGSADHAADIVQDTYLRLAQAPEPLRAIENIRAYVFRVAGNLAIDRMRRERWLESRHAAEDGTTVPDPLALPEASFLARERLALLDEALGRLSPNARRALLMSRLEGRTFAEIAEALGVSESMVAKYIAQALRACRDRLRQADGEG